MSTQRTFKYIFAAVFSMLAHSLLAAAPDSTATTDTALKHPIAGHQLTVGVDISAPVKMALQPDRTVYEFAADYYLKNELYLAAEAGWGGGKVNYTDLKYSSNNNFIRLGFHKFLFPRENLTDWGGMLLGLRLGYAAIQRGEATYTLVDSFWGSNTGVAPARSFGAAWAELNGGVRVELWHGFMAGWTIRGKFLLNSKSFNDLSPLFIAGYGRGDKNAVFDMHFYLNYGIRWRRK